MSSGSPVDRRAEPRLPVALRVRLAARNEAELAEHRVLNLSRGGLFIRTDNPKPIGTVVRLVLELADGSVAIRAVGEVRYVALPQSHDPSVIPGMGVRFLELDPRSRELLDRLCAAPAPPPLRG